MYELAKDSKKLWLSPSGVSYGTYQKVLEGAEEARDSSRGKRRRTEHGHSPGQAGVHEAQSPIQLAKAVKVCLPACVSVYYGRTACRCAARATCGRTASVFASRGLPVHRWHGLREMIALAMLRVKVTRRLRQRYSCALPEGLEGLASACRA